ncbi:tigger transposable element-derived protein [Plakobranchus ocellatus]|uniref:Tigger transposable element-derived protein n=1 Tax=Plakobranchus ocellatus TaxID=259542 RepID=A0AAV4AJI7_9GAST|nr:tigger transposable element-derived protein [Plakobranchus ocellatus]
MRRPETEDVDCARSKNLPLSGPILVEKAKEFDKRLGDTSFTGSTGWLDRFKSRHGIVMKRICGESAAVCQETTEGWKDTQLKKILEEFSPDDIFMDETGLFFKCLPNRTLALKGEKGTGGKIPQERITLIVAANMSGTEKLPLLTIGKFQKPRCLKNIKTLPTEYKASTKAWMTGAIFEDWVRRLDRKYLLKGRSIALVIDNCPAHPAIESLKMITFVFLPPNTTSILQPCNQGIIQALKMHYKTRFEESHRIH